MKTYSTSHQQAVRFHPNVNYIATASGDKTCRLWDTQTGQSVRLLTRHKSPVMAIAFSPNGRYLASGCTSGDVSLWDLGSGRRLKYFESAHTQTITSLSFSECSGILVSAGMDSCVKVWDISVGDGDEPMTLSAPKPYGQHLFLLLTQY